MNTKKTSKQPSLNWREYDLLIMYIADDPDRFREHIEDFGYTKREAARLQQHIQHTLATQAASIHTSREHQDH